MPRKRDRSDPEMASLLQEMAGLSEAMKDAYVRFNCVDDPDLIEATIFEINACKARYNYILRCVKAKNGVPMARPHAVQVPKVAVAAVSAEGGDVCLT